MTRARAETVSGVWFYISFADPDRPKGTQFLGGCYVEVVEEHREEDELAVLLHPRRVRKLNAEEMLVARAIRESHRLGINPGGEARVLGPLSEEGMDKAVPEEDRRRLLTRGEVNRD